MFKVRLNARAREHEMCGKITTVTTTKTQIQTKNKNAICVW